MTEDLVYRLRKRAEIRRQIQTRKSVQEGKPDRLADLLEEAANEIENLHNLIKRAEKWEEIMERRREKRAAEIFKMGWRTGPMPWDPNEPRDVAD